MIVGRSLKFSDPARNPPVVQGQANPIRRDVFQIPSGQSITLRVVADNPGAWIFHCKSKNFSFIFFTFFLC
jgi:iron transport multicopper oxidase